MKNVIILLSVFLFLFVAVVGHAGDTNTKRKYYFVSDEQGEIVDVYYLEGDTSKKCKKEAKGAKGVMKIFNDKVKKEGYTIESITNDLIKLTKNPDCWIFIGNIPVCWCCY